MFSNVSSNWRDRFCRLAPAPVTVETAAAAPWFHDAHRAGVRWAPMPRGWGGSLPQETSRWMVTACYTWKDVKNVKTDSIFSNKESFVRHLWLESWELFEKRCWIVWTAGFVTDGFTSNILLFTSIYWRFGTSKFETFLGNIHIL